MRNHLRKQIRAITALALLIALAMVPAVGAQQASSNNYQVNDVFFGAGGQLNSCSSNYCSKQSAGETGVGKVCSTSYCAHAGFNTNREPSLTFIVPSASINLGIQTAGVPSTAQTTFSVESYLSSGYIVQTVGNPPSAGGHTIAPLTSPGVFNASQEQFGINLVANNGCTSLPASLGANPKPVPDSSFSFGTYQAGYGTACSFKYNNGDTIAYSNSSSGETDYTISYLLNTTPTTPAGTYTMNQILVATATF